MGKNKIDEPSKAMVFASFIGDALSLGPHWIYNAEKLKALFGRVGDYITPPKGSYHEGKEAGDFTHYGDQALVLLESFASRGGFDAEDFSKRWRKLFESYDGYIDGATRETLMNLASGSEPLKAGSSSNDLAGASRIAPVVYAYKDDEDAMVYAARTQTRMTHNNSDVIDAAEFFARVTKNVLYGENPIAAIRKNAKERFEESHVSEWVERGLNSLELPSETAIKGFGQSCHIPEAFPSVIHLIGRYGENLREALIENTMAGGDSAARGMLVGMVLGVYHGMESLPVKWVEGMKKGDYIASLLERVKID